MSAEQLPFEWWMENVFPTMKSRFPTIPNKSRWFIDKDGIKVQDDKIDQSMLSHVFNAVASVHQIVNALGLRENGMLTLQDERLVYAEITIHDLHKMEKDPVTGATFGHLIEYGEYEKFARVMGIDESILSRQAIDERIGPAIDHHHPKKDNVMTTALSNPRSILYERDIMYWLLMLGDRVASSTGVEDARYQIEDTLSSMRAKVPGCSQLAWNIAFHETNPFDGDLVALIDGIVEQEMDRRGWKPVLFYSNGTVYISPETREIDMPSLNDAIATAIDGELAGENIKMTVEQNKIAIKTKGYQEKVSLPVALAALASKMSRSDLQRTFDKFTGKARDMDRGNVLDQYHHDIYTHAVVLFLTAVRAFIKDFGVAKSNDDATVSMLLTGSDLSIIMKNAELLDTSGKRQPNQPPTYLIPLATEIRGKVYAPGKSMEDFLHDLHDLITSKLLGEAETCAENAMLCKIKELVPFEIGINCPPDRLVDDDFGFSAYTKAHEKPIGIFKSRCFLCGSTSNLEKAGPDLARSPLKIETDRVPSGKTIGSEKMICSRCYLKLAARNMKIPWIKKEDIGNIFYITIMPDHVFTRDHEKWLMPYISSIFQLSKKDYQKAKKVDPDDVPGIMEESAKIYPYIIDRIADDLVTHAIENDASLGTMHELIAGAIERKCSFKRFETGVEPDGVDMDGERASFVKSRYIQNNGFVIPFKFMDDMSQTSMWFITAALGMLISITTGSRVVITQDYGNIPLMPSRAAVTLDSPPSKVERVLGTTIELAGHDIEHKFVMAMLLLYLNNKAGRPDKPSQNTIPLILERYITAPATMIDWCWRYANGVETPSRKVFFNIFETVDYLASEVQRRAVVDQG